MTVVAAVCTPPTMSSCSDPGGTAVHPKYLNTVPNVTWHEDTSLWVTGNKVPIDNIWYFASRTSPIYVARRFNRTGSLPFVLPPLRENDVIFLPDSSGYNGEDSKDWCRTFFQVCSCFAAVDVVVAAVAGVRGVVVF